jgi:tetratricopeptide (TPR) repeat protein
MPSLIRLPLERLLTMLLVVLLAGVPLNAGAQTPEARQQAKEKFQEAQTAYHLGEFQKALAAYTEAYRLLPLPDFLFNVAQCHRQLGNAESAAFSYRRYLDLATKAKGHPPDNAALTQELLVEMESQARQQKTRRQPARDAAPAKKPGTLASQGTEAGEKRVKQADSRQLTSVPTPAPAATVEQGGLHKQWWVWAGAGAVVLLATGGAVYAATSSQPRSTTLGTIR